jgi:GT2 family glycosyltransferase
MEDMERMRCRVSVAILNWNGEAHLRRYLPSVCENTGAEDKVVVIDNGSTDGSRQLLEVDFPEVHVVALNENHGFAGGYNRGLAAWEEQCSSEWVLLLNSDVEVTEGWTDGMVDACLRQGWVAAQPKIRSWERRSEFEYAGAAGGYMDRHGFMFCAGRIFDVFEEDQGQYDEEREVFWASGAALLVQADAWREVNGLDEDFFAHMEEIDLCWRLRNRGHAIGVATAALVYHLGGGTLNASSPRKAELNFRNNLFLLLKNDHRHGIGVRIFWRQCLDGLAAVRFLTEGKSDFFKAVINAHGDFRRQRKAMGAKRKKEIQVCSGLEAPARTAGHYRGSIVLDFFLRGRGKWSDLPPHRFV